MTSPTPTTRRVLQLVTRLTAGGAQETVLLLAEHLPRFGIEVVVASAPEGPGVKRLRSLGVDHVSIPHLAREVSPFKDLMAYAEIRGLVRRGRFDVVHTHSSKAGVLGRLAARRERTPAIIHTSHGLPVSPDTGRVERAMLLGAERFAARRCDRIVGVSRTTSAHLEQLGLARADQLAVIPSGVYLPPPGANISREDARASFGLARDRPVLGWVGRFFDIKRPLTVVAVAKQVLAQVPDAAVLLAGDGPLMNEVRAATSGDERIRLLGYTPEVDAVYAALDVCLLVSAYEGMPRTILEAQAAGVPVVATDVGGIREVVQDNKNGFLFPPENERALVAAVISILKNPELRTRLGGEARAAVGKTYSVEHMAAETSKLYDEVLGRGPAPFH